MNKNTLNSLNAEDKNYTPHYNSQGGKKSIKALKTLILCYICVISQD